MLGGEDHTLGQKRPNLPWLPAAKSTTEQRVKFVPLADSCAAATKGLFDYPVGLSDQARRNLQAKLFGRLEVDDRLIDDFHFCIKTRRC